MCNVVQLFLAANAILLMRKRNHAFLLLAIALAWKWQTTSLLVACVQTSPPPPRKKSRFFLRERGGGRLYTGYASRRYSIKKQTRWSNNKTIIELGYRKISRFVSGEQINYLPKPRAKANNWSARHWHEQNSICSQKQLNDIAHEHTIICRHAK